MAGRPQCRSDRRAARRGIRNAVIGKVHRLQLPQRTTTNYAPAPPRTAQGQATYPPPAPGHRSQIGMTPAEVKQLFAQLQAEHQRQLSPPVMLERKPAPQPSEVVQIEGGSRRMKVLPPARTMPAKPEPLRLASQKKSIADRVAVALLTRPKTRA